MITTSSFPTLIISHRAVRAAVGLVTTLRGAVLVAADSTSNKPTPATIKEK
jgi:hypothetical protein